MILRKPYDLKMCLLFLIFKFAAVSVCVEAFASIDVVHIGQRKPFPHALASVRPCFIHSTAQRASDTLFEDPLKYQQNSSIIFKGSDINSELARLCQMGNIAEAIALLSKNMVSSETEIDEMSYATLVQSMVNKKWPNSTTLAEDFLRRMKRVAIMLPSCAPKRYAYNAVIFAWSKTFLKDAGPRCHELLNELWAAYNETEDLAYLPLRSSYISTLSAWARCGRKLEAAQNAELLLEEMERYRAKHPHLAPSTFCVNTVLTAWSKSGSRAALDRCETILKRMEDLALNGRAELRPTTTSFNIVIDALAHYQEYGAERRAEALLEKMDTLSNTEGIAWSCKPNQVSYNSVLNCWARSRERGAAGRAEAILRHMERRYSSNCTDVRPDAATYTTVLNAWARSHDQDAAERAEKVLQRMEIAYQEGNLRARPNAMSYNTIINVCAKSKDPNGLSRALETLELMKQLSKQHDRSDCRPDVFTYTSVIDCLAKSATHEASNRAEKLLRELEAQFRESEDRCLQPTVHTYTSVVNAIARSRVRPERAEAIVQRLSTENKFSNSNLRPDVVLYNALLNAYGWSSMKGKAEKCFQLFKTMLSLYESGENLDLKPDIITCNSVLNACAFEIAESKDERAAVMDIVVRTFEVFQSSAPSFGWPNHITYGYVLLAITKHMPTSAKRLEAAEVTFWQACRSGHLGALVVTQLRLALSESWETFARLMGPALLSKEGELLRFDLSRLPAEWSQHAPYKSKRRESRPSSKQVGPHVTKQFVKRSIGGNVL